MNQIPNTPQTTIPIETKALLSSLWIFFLLNLIFRDIHDLFRPGLIEEMLTGIVNDTPITDELLLAGSVAIEIPIAMVPLSQVLSARVNYWINIIAGSLVLGSVISTQPMDLDDVFFKGFEMIALLLIMGLAWRWSRRKPV